MHQEAPETTSLLRRARAGEKAALEHLYRRYGGKLLGVIRLRLGRQLRARLESGDVLQACLLRSFEKIEDFEGGDGAALMAWLARIAENEIRDQADFHGRQRRDANLVTTLDEDHAEVATRMRSALSGMILDEQGERLERALETLPEDQRAVILLRKYEELSFADVGRRMGRSEDACRMLLARAMAALTRAMDPVS